MPVLPTNDALVNAYQLLASTVREFSSNGRPGLGATLKPALYSRGRFSEQFLGFRKFGDFLRAAETAGYVQLRPTPGGDIEVLLPGTQTSESLTRPSGPTFGSMPSSAQPSFGPPPLAPIHIRQDFWDAFNSFSAKWVYDPVADRALREADVASVRPATGSAPHLTLVPIPLGRDRVLEWMRSFANMQDPETKEQLLAVLQGDSALFHFNNVTRSRRLQRSWGRFHVQNVLQAIEAWASSNNVHPRDITTPLYLRAPTWPIPPSPCAPVPDPLPTAPSFNTLLLSGHLESLIDNLIDELLRLRGVLQVVVPKRS